MSCNVHVSDHFQFLLFSKSVVFWRSSFRRDSRWHIQPRWHIITCDLFFRTINYFSYQFAEILQISLQINILIYWSLSAIDFLLIWTGSVEGSKHQEWSGVKKTTLLLLLSPASIFGFNIVHSFLYDSLNLLWSGQKIWKVLKIWSLLTYRSPW